MATTDRGIHSALATAVKRPYRVTVTTVRWYDSDQEAITAAKHEERAQQADVRVTALAYPVIDTRADRSAEVTRLRALALYERDGRPYQTKVADTPDD